MHFAFPWAFLLLILIPPVSWLAVRMRARPGVRFSSTSAVGTFKPTLRRRLATLPEVLRFAALVLITVAVPGRGWGSSLSGTLPGASPSS